jgi:hypothetical protein
MELPSSAYIVFDLIKDHSLSAGQLQHPTFNEIAASYIPYKSDDEPAHKFYSDATIEIPTRNLVVRRRINFASPMDHVLELFITWLNSFNRPIILISQKCYRRTLGYLLIHLEKYASPAVRDLFVQLRVQFIDSSPILQKAFGEQDLTKAYKKVYGRDLPNSRSAECRTTALRDLLKSYGVHNLRRFDFPIVGKYPHYMANFLSSSSKSREE